MQIVLSNNRVIAYGENSFLAMGGTVICEKTGKTYQNATVAEVENIPCDIDTVGYEYHAGAFVPCAPYGMDDGTGYIMVACRECGTPKRSDVCIDEILGARIIVNAMPGSIVTAENGRKTVVLKEEREGRFVGNLPAYGDWMILAEYNGSVGCRGVFVDALKEYSVTMTATISVKYLKGAVCKIYQENHEYYAPDASGYAVFPIHSTGNWSASASWNIEGKMGGAVETFRVDELKGQNIEVDLTELLDTTTAPDVSLLPTDGITYTRGIEHLTWAQISSFAKKLSVLQSITDATKTVYASIDGGHYKICVGDEKVIDVNGKANALQILGFRHDTAADPDTYGATKAGVTFGIKNIAATRAYGSGRIWDASEMRAAMDGYKTALANNPGLIAGIVDVNKEYISGTGSSAGIATVADSLFLLSAYEISGKSSAVANMAAEGERYAFFAGGNSWAKTYNGTARYWWTRSPGQTSSSMVAATAGETYLGACVNHNVNDEEIGVVFALCM